MATHVLVVLLLVMGTEAAAQPGVGELEVVVRSEGQPVTGAIVNAGFTVAKTDETGTARLDVAAGKLTVAVEAKGYLTATYDVEIEATRTRRIEVDLVEVPEIEEEVVVVATTRTGRRLEDQPTRVEVLDREEIEEKMLMTPGDIVMMLNEMGGLRVQATSPSLGAASVRVQGMKGRYTRFLSDGLPLFGQQVGGLGLLQVPPMDLGRVEVIKGAASALYGAGAMSGVVNLLARRPGPSPVAEMLANASTLGATDAVLFLSSRAATPGWSASVLAGGHGQARNDRDDDGWADLARYARGMVRPRLFWDGGNGRSVFLTAGLTVENRDGGTMPGSTLPATGLPYAETLDTRRVDAGGTAQALLKERFVLTARGAAAWQRHDALFGEVVERDRHDTAFAEVALRGAAGRHTWVAGAAYERDDFSPRDTPQFAYTFNVPGVFAQDDVDLASWLSVSIGARLDVHDEYGTFFSPRVAALFRAGEWTSRVSAGQGFFASTPLTEETEAAGLSRLTVIGPLEAERGRSVSWDLTRRLGAGSATATVFASRVSDPVAVDRDDRYALFNRSEDTTNVGAELLATWRAGSYVATGTYTYVRAREHGDAGLQDVALTPRHSAGIVGMWEDDDVGRVGLEVYYTGSQRLEVNPYRDQSRTYTIVGMLVEKRFGRLRAFLNAENITDVRQTRWDPVVRPSQNVDGRWTVDAWAPLDGRVFNGGVRVAF
jgi:outer membrane receptor for ferrienterochelin and colicins